MPSAGHAAAASAASAAGRRHSGNVAPRLAAVLLRRAQRREARLADFEDFLAIGHALEAPAAVRFPDQVFAAFAEFARGAVRERFGRRRQQDLPGPRQRHQARRRAAWRGLRLPAAWRRPAPRLRCCCQVSTSPTCRPARACSSSLRSLQFRAVAEFAQAARVVEREAEAIDRALEQQQQAIGTVDQAAAPALLQFEHEAIVRAEQLRGRRRRRGVRPGRSNRTGRSAAGCAPAGCLPDAKPAVREVVHARPLHRSRLGRRERVVLPFHAVAAQPLGAIQRRVGEGVPVVPLAVGRRPGRRRR